MVLDAGHLEAEKAAVHAVLGLLAGVCAIYNVAAFVRRRERHLAVNAVIYTALTVLEIKQVRRHVRDDR